MTGNDDLRMTVADEREAFTEVSFLLDTFASTIHDLMGGATAPVGRIGGRHMARKLPVHLPEPTLETVLECVAGQFKSGYDLSASCAERGAEVEFGRCAIRAVCRERNLQPGGDLCKLFHYYLDGIVNELLQRPVKSEIVATGDSCRTRMQVR
jgi:hypothetical protein